MPQLFTTVFVAALAGWSLATPSIIPASSQHFFGKVSSSCPATGAISCHNTTVERNTCCFEAPGGLLLLTQLWDTNPPRGPEDSWTIHGLWPDNCDGTYESDCDPSRNYPDIAGLLTDQGAGDTLTFMETYWIDIHGKNEHFWQHEWSKHGTCYSTLRPECLPEGSPTGAEAVAFFKTVVALFQALPTYTWLEDQGITPSNSHSYSRSDILSALESQSGGPAPVLECKHGALTSISWYFNVKGSVMDGNFVPTDAPHGGNCPARGIKYRTK